jgi:hypothetical protein
VTIVVNIKGTLTRAVKKNREIANFYPPFFRGLFVLIIFLLLIRKNFLIF